MLRFSAGPLSSLLLVTLAVSCTKVPDDPFADAGDNGEDSTIGEDSSTGDDSNTGSDGQDGDDTIGDGDGDGTETDDNADDVGTGDSSDTGDDTGDTGDTGGTADDTGDTSDGDTGDTSDGDTGDTSDGDTGDTSDGDTGDTSDGDTGDTSDGDTGGDTGDTGDTSDGDTGGDTGDTGGDDTGTEEPEPCQVSTQTVEPVPPNVLLVLDKSRSMRTETWDHDSDGGTPEVRRWVSLHSAVTLLTSTYESDVKFGAKLFPAYTACTSSQSCGCVVDPVEVECALDNSMEILDAIPAANYQLEGYTPTVAGLNAASTYLQTIPATEPRAMMLVADGAGNCNGEDTDDAVAEVTAAAAAGIPTYVIGIDAEDDPNSSNDTHDQLSALAVAGGKPNPAAPPSFYQTQNAAELQQAMDDIIADALSCVISIDPEPTSPELFQVWIEDAQIDEVADCATEDGWVWTQQHSEIEFCGTACDTLKAAGEMEGRYFCRPQ